MGCDGHGEDLDRQGMDGFSSAMQRGVVLAETIELLGHSGQTTCSVLGDPSQTLWLTEQTGMWQLHDQSLMVH